MKRFIFPKEEQLVLDSFSSGDYGETNNLGYTCKPADNYDDGTCLSNAHWYCVNAGGFFDVSNCTCSISQLAFSEEECSDGTYNGAAQECTQTYTVNYTSAIEGFESGYICAEA